MFKPHTKNDRVVTSMRHKEIDLEVGFIVDNLWRNQIILSQYHFVAE